MSKEFVLKIEIDVSCIFLMQVFHICNPVYNNDGELDRMDKYSFVCGEGTVFDQQTLTCNYPEDAFPCQESPSLYGAVEFGKVDSDYDY